MDHPLIGDKPRKTMEFFKEKSILKNIQVFSPSPATDQDLLRVHSEKYLQRIHELSEKGGMLAIDTPAPKGIYEIASLATGGSILAGVKLFEGFNIMANPLAGFHHAGKETSSGFCFFNDIAVTIEYLREKKGLKRFFIVDLDVHHGNGTQDIYGADPTVLNVSFHQDGRTLYPGTGSNEYIGKDDGMGYTVNLPLPPGTGSEAVQYAFKALIPPLVKQFNPQIIIYQSGVDTHSSDPLADLSLSYQTYHHLAGNIRQLSKNSCDKLLVLFGGGYNSDASIYSYYNIMCGLLKRSDYIREEDTTRLQKYEKIKELVLTLQTILKPYWNFE
jgi:acetoin utilization protein AcuC